ncbi:MAG: helix-turn-helix transcriptional regulator, partial [Candidatus Omnitrophica bacterium]|nr:helix-turn-helix transcriptional regulator [Candidatus Omnitrophota bacterium]
MSKKKTRIILNKSRRINNRLRYYRKLKGYTQSDVAKILLLNQSDISNWEQGLKYPGTKNLLKLSIAYSRF